MEFEVLGWQGEGVTVDLDHRTFSYAGKFVMSATGKAVVRDSGMIVAATSFSEDRTTPDRMWIRYLTVRSDRRGERIGTRVAGAVRERILAQEHNEVRIAVNNPFAYQALHRAGFGYTGEQTGIAELVLSSDLAPNERYQAGLLVMANRPNLAPEERVFIDKRVQTGPPDPMQPPTDWIEASP